MTDFDNRVSEVAGEWHVAGHDGEAEFRDGEGHVVVAIDGAAYRNLLDLEGTTLLSRPMAAPHVWWHDSRVYLAPPELDAVEVAGAVDAPASAAE